MASSPGYDPNRRREPLRPHRGHHGELHARPRRCSTARAPGSSSRARRSRWSPRPPRSSRGSSRRSRRSTTPATASSTASRSTTSPTRTGPRSSARQPRHGPRALDQLGLLQHRQEARRQGDPRHGEALRLLRAPAARDAGGRAPPERALPQRQALLPQGRRERRPGTHRLRPGADARDAAADGDGRGGRSAIGGTADGAARRRPDRRARRAGRRGAAPDRDSSGRQQARRRTRSPR